MNKVIYYKTKGLFPGTELPYEFGYARTSNNVDFVGMRYVPRLFVDEFRLFAHPFGSNESIDFGGVQSFVANECEVITSEDVEELKAKWHGLLVREAKNDESK